MSKSTRATSKSMATAARTADAAGLVTQDDGTVVSKSGVVIGKAETSPRRLCDKGRPVVERRRMVVKALRKMRATSAGTAKTATEIAAKCGLSRFDVYGQLYHTHKLQTDGFVKQIKDEGARELGYYLTAKGEKATDDLLA